MTEPVKRCPYESDLGGLGSEPIAIERRRGQKAPGPWGFPLIGSLPAMRRDVLGLMLRGMREHGDVVRFKIGPWTVHLICHPDDIAHVFSQPERYDKQTFASAKIRQVTGDGLLVTNGQIWADQRSAVQPAFAQSRVDGYLGLIIERTQKMLDRWARVCQSGEPIDIASEMMRLTYGIVEQALFSTETGEGIGEIEEAVTIAIGHAYRQIEQPLCFPSFVPTRANRRFNQAMRTLHRRVDLIIDEHRSQVGKLDLLGDLMTGLEQKGAGGAGVKRAIDDRSLRSQTITLLLAGHETTANSLTWLWWLLDQNREVAERMHEEAIAILPSGPMTKDNTKQLAYTSMAIREAMRLYTPIWAIFRRVLADDLIQGYCIKKGTLAIISPYVTHRHPDFWVDAERFDPLRFESEKVRALHRCAYIPFGGGPRFCVGKNLANLEGLVIAAMISQRFRLRAVPGQNVVPDPGITLRCRNGLQMFIEARGGGR